MNPEPRESSHQECLAALQAIPDLIFQIKDDGTFLNYKGDREDLYVPPEQFIGKKVQDVLPEQLARQTLEYMGLALESQKLQVYEYNLPIGDHLKYFEARMVAYEKDKVLVVVRDITERKDLEIECKRLEDLNFETEQQFHHLFMNSPIGMGVADLEGNLITFNKTMLKSGGYNEEDIKIIGKVALLYYNAEERNKALALFIEQGYISDFPVQFKRKDGSPYDALLSLSRTLFRGKPCILAIVQDITERKRTEEKEKEYATRLSYLSKYANDLIILLDSSFHFLETNERVEEMYGYTHDELAGMHASNLRAPETKAAFTEQVKAAVANGRGIFETIHQRKDGRKFPVEISLRAIDIDGKRLYQAIIRDITERKQAEKDLQEKMKELKLINEVAVGRELKMIELEREVDRLLSDLGRPPKYQ